MFFRNLSLRTAFYFLLMSVAPHLVWAITLTPEQQNWVSRYPKDRIDFAKRHAEGLARQMGLNLNDVVIDVKPELRFHTGQEGGFKKGNTWLDLEGKVHLEIYPEITDNPILMRGTLKHEHRHALDLREVYSKNPGKLIKGDGKFLLDGKYEYWFEARAYEDQLKMLDDMENSGVLNADQVKFLREYKSEIKYKLDNWKEMQQLAGSPNPLETGNAGAVSQAQAEQINSRAVTDPKPTRPIQTGGGKQIRKSSLPDMTKSTKVKNPKLLKRYNRIAQRLFKKKYPNLMNLKNNGIVLEHSEVIPEYRDIIEQDLMKDQDLVMKYRQQRSAHLKYHVKQHVRREARTASKTFANYKASLTSQQKKDIARTRKLAEQSTQNSFLSNLLAKLIGLDLVISFTRGYYDGGWPVLSEMMKGTFFSAAAFTMTSVAVMSIPTGAEMVWAATPYIGPLTQAVFLTLAIEGIATNTSYLAVDYFLLSDNRTALIKTLYPEESVNVFDFWSFYQEVYKQGLNPRTLYRIADRWHGFKKLDVNLTDHMARAIEILVNRYRKWLLDNHPETPRLGYFKNDQKVWNNLATVILNDMRLSIIIRELEESRKINLAVMQEEEKKELAGEAIIEEGEQDAPAGGFLGEIDAPRNVEKGEYIPVKCACILYGFPGEKLEPTVHIRLIDDEAKVIDEKSITKSFEFSEEKYYVTFEISEDLVCALPGNYQMEVSIEQDQTVIESRQMPLQIGGEEIQGQALKNILDDLRKLADEAEETAGVARSRCNEAVALIGLVTAGAGELRLGAQSLENSVHELEPQLEEMKSLAKEIQELHRDAEKGAARTGALAGKVENLSLRMCEKLAAYRNTDHPEARKRLHAEMQEMSLNLKDLFSEARRKVDEVKMAAEDARARHENMEKKRADFEKLEETESLSDRITKLTENLSRASQEIEGGRQKIAQLSEIKSKGRGKLDEGMDLLKDLADKERAEELEKDLEALFGRIERALRDVDHCPDQARQMIGPARQDLDAVRPAVSDAESSRNRLLASPLLGKENRKQITEKVDLTEYLSEMAEGYFERAGIAAEDATFCFTMASDLDKNPRRTEIPRVEGMTVEEAGRTLEKKGFRAEFRAIGSPPRKDLEYRIQSQEPKERVMAIVGSSVILHHYGQFDIKQALASTDCSRWPGSAPVWNNQTNTVQCGCTQGMAWNSARTRCVDYRQAALENTDCSRWPGSVPVWNNQTNTVQCGCTQGMAWNSARTRCVDYRQAALENTDCSRWPGSVPLWNNQTNKVQCVCPQGKIWNSARSACVSPSPGNSGGGSGGTSGGGGGQRSGGSPSSGGGGMSKLDCEKKYCPICGDDDLVMLGQSSDAQCMRCKDKYRKQIEACLRGETGGQGNTYDSFKKYKVYQCLNRKWDAYNKRYNQWYTYYVCGPQKPCPSGGTISSCKPVTPFMTEVQAGFELQRLSRHP